ncbi:hypothetical protein E2320_011052 [Naja naja]|nr:hypothetical protein E2320_011052 [Naja naja]
MLGACSDGQIFSVLFGLPKYEDLLLGVESPAVAGWEPRPPVTQDVVWPTAWLQSNGFYATTQHHDSPEDSENRSRVTVLQDLMGRRRRGGGKGNNEFTPPFQAEGKVLVISQMQEGQINNNKRYSIMK